MATIDESRELMRKIYNLPSNLATLRKRGFSDDDIQSYTDFFDVFDPKANSAVKKMKDLLDRWQVLDDAELEQRKKLLK